MQTTDLVSRSQDWWTQFYHPVRQIGHRVAEFFSPSAEAAATTESYEISLELPGISKDEIHLEAYGDRLVVTGEKQAEREERGRNFYFSERVYGRFRRTFQVPADANLAEIGAVHKDGVLTITIPKVASKPAEGRRIQIGRG